VNARRRLAGTLSGAHYAGGRFDPGLLVGSMRAQAALTKLARKVRASGEPILIAWSEITVAGLFALFGVGRRTIREIVRIALFDSPADGERLSEEIKTIESLGPRCPHCRRPL
jgi:hypothetical protein